MCYSGKCELEYSGSVETAGYCSITQEEKKLLKKKFSSEWPCAQPEDEDYLAGMRKFITDYRNNKHKLIRAYRKPLEEFTMDYQCTPNPHTVVINNKK